MHIVSNLFSQPLLNGTSKNNSSNNNIIFQYNHWTLSLSPRVQWCVYKNTNKKCNHFVNDQVQAYNSQGLG